MIAWHGGFPPSPERCNAKDGSGQSPDGSGRLAGKTLALVGAGRIGRRMARMARAGFDMRVLAFDPYVDAANLLAEGITRIDSLVEMLPEADFVSVHCVLNEKTRHIIGAPEIARLNRQLS